MTIKRKLLAIAILAALAGVAQPAAAGVIDSADVAGFGTFQDTNTGRVWLDLDNFFNQTPNQMIAAATGAGFTFGTTADVQQLLNSLPLTEGAWTSYKAVMGDAPDRELIWGVSDDGGDPFGDAFAFAGDPSWTYQTEARTGNVVPNDGTELADLNIWAYQTGTSVPEPATLALLGLGLAGLGFSRRKQ